MARIGRAAVNLILCVPVNRFLVPRPAATLRSITPQEAAPAATHGIGGGVGFASGAPAAHLPHLLAIFGESTTAAIAEAKSMGPAQGAARLFELAC